MAMEKMPNVPGSNEPPYETEDQKLAKIRERMQKEELKRPRPETDEETLARLRKQDKGKGTKEIVDEFLDR